MRPAATGRVWRKSQRHAWKGNDQPSYALRYMTSPAPVALEAAGPLPGAHRAARHQRNACHHRRPVTFPPRMGALPHNGRHPRAVTRARIMTARIPRDAGHPIRYRIHNIAAYWVCVAGERLLRGTPYDPRQT